MSTCVKKNLEPAAGANARASDTGSRTKYSKPLVDPRKCSKCKYRARAGGGSSEFSCGFLYIKGYTRTSLHPEGLTPDCKEFEPRPMTHKYQAERR